MTKEEKTKRTREKLINSAIEMFGERGYEGFNINEFCRTYDVSKGILYHNFSGRDELYLEGAKKCYSEFTEFLENSGKISDIRQYMKVRLKFFLEHPIYEKFFFEILLRPPFNLIEEIRTIQEKQLEFNKQVFRNLITDAPLREKMTIEEALDYFDIMQEVFNRKFIKISKDAENLDVLSKYHEEKIEKFIDYLLYGIIERH